jgi:hypothetical protein
MCGLKEVAGKILLSLISLILSLLCLEVGVRAYFGEFAARNFWLEQHDLLRSAYPVEFSPTLGWIPKAGSAARPNLWGTTVTILADGIRANRSGELPSRQRSGDLILAVGDSFTFGDQVSDAETWPALLQEMTGRRVLNGGVFGYGIDQTYLRMKGLSEKYLPTVIIFGFTPDDIDRCELSERTSVTKPYFEKTATGLELRDLHVTPRQAGGDTLRRILGYSLLVHKTMDRVFPSYWRQGAWGSKKAHGNGPEVACLIFEKVVEFWDAHPEIDAIYVLAQYPVRVTAARRAKVKRVLDCIADTRLHLIDMEEVLSTYRRASVAAYQSLFGEHMTPKGNEVVASTVAAALRGQSLDRVTQPSRPLAVQVRR